MKFDKDELVNLEYSLKREFLITNKGGGYCSSTIVCCNTRKYHGLLILPIEEFNGENHVILSSLDESIIQDDQVFNLGIHKYPGIYEPRGHKYIVDFEYESSYSITYRVGDVILKKEIIMPHDEALVMIRYTLKEAQLDTVLRLKPFLAYRSIHKLSKANMYINTKYDEIPNGVKYRLYSKFPALNMQLSKTNEFIAVPDWYYNIEYMEEQARGYDYKEDLFVPGYFEVSLKKGDSVVFAASTEGVNPVGLKRKFQQIKDKQIERRNFKDCLKYSAAQFIVEDGKDREVVAGYPWFGRWGRDTFIALPGITLYANGDVKSCKRVLDTVSRQLHNGLFPNIGKPPYAAYNSVDAPLWYFHAIQEYDAFINKSDKKESVWRSWGAEMKAILSAFKFGINPGIKMMESGLIWAEQPGKALTWMDAIVGGVPVTPRAGYAVEINALWYNSVCYALELASKAGDKLFVKEWRGMPEQIRRSFIETFWYDNGRYLADYVDKNGQNIFVRPNQVFACSLPFSPISDEMKADVLEVVRRELLTPYGLRTLSPKNPYYEGGYEGDQSVRDMSYHQGTVWPWLIGAYIEANLKLYKKQFVPRAKEILSGFEDNIALYGIGSIAEVYDGNPPHRPNGSISQAWSVGEVLRSLSLIQEFKG